MNSPFCHCSYSVFQFVVAGGLQAAGRRAEARRLRRNGNRSSVATETVTAFRRNTRFVAALVLVTLGGCGRSSPGPSRVGSGGVLTPQVPLAPGLQRLQLTGFSFSSDPDLPACTPFGVPRHGTSVNVPVLVSKDGADWVIRSESQTDSLVLRIQATGQLYQGLDAIAGVISGSARDVGEPPISFTVDVEIVIGTAPPASVTGGVSPPLGSNTTSTFANGRIGGSIQFRDSQGNASTCTAIIWSLRPPFPA